LNTKESYRDKLVIFPGARTTSLIWDFDKGLDNFRHQLRIFLVETNGLPNQSEGQSPDIRSLDYGIWAGEVLDKLHIDKAFVAGASFGGLICMKLGIVYPEKIKAAFLLNPGCLQPFSLTVKNLYFNLLPILKPTAKNVLKFLDKAVFCKPDHQLTPFSEKMLVDYEVFAIKQYKDNTQKPYFMDQQLKEMSADTFVLLGDKDLLFPYQKSMENAKKLIRPLKEIKIFQNVGHGIETCDKALQYVGDIMRRYP
jgi:pimeloyl-ACP methyl ester carboxylesterase